MKQPQTVGKDIKFDRIRRITGYLVGTTDRFNNAKQAEERDRVKHDAQYSRQ
ncbi:MAG: ribonucleoside-triphosphate reductase [Peptococcaceae bacterium]|jgi:anaerobic ribonucleoside-triphosphate reductase|nr:ribonucleoside-triphosphate reductase [Peptococcaceae bacterium]MDR2736761.1 ribonucleoside-triphosphate reductase [Gracilibacteraceae bacterium]